METDTSRFARADISQLTFINERKRYRSALETNTSRFARADISHRQFMNKRKRYRSMQTHLVFNLDSLK